MSKMVLACATALAAFSVQSAQAALVASWDWSAQSQWGITTFNVGYDGAASGTVDNSLTSPRISWGDPAPESGTNPSALKSYLEVTKSVGVIGNSGDDLTTYVGNVVNPLLNGCAGVNGGPVSCLPGAIMSHGNNTLRSGSTTLNTTQLLDTLTVQIPGGALAPGFPETVTFDITFTETPNTGNCGGDDLFGGSPCPDKFLLTNAGGLVQTFTVDDYVYTFFLSLDPTLGGSGSVTFNADGSLLIRTKEPGITSLNTYVGIFAQQIPQQVPEPASLALLGLGIAGLGLARRRRAA